MSKRIEFNVVKANVVEQVRMRWLTLLMAYDNNINVIELNKMLEETAAANNFIVSANSQGYTLPDDEMATGLIQAFIAANSAYLSVKKVADAKKAVALVLTDLAGVFKFASVVMYHETEDEKGNWSFAYVLNEEDLDAIANERELKKYAVTDDGFKTIFDKVCYDVACVEFNQERYMYDSALITVNVLLSTLDKEAVDGETIDIELAGYFTATVAVINGEKEFSMVPDGAMKEIVKGDLELDKK